MAHVGKAAKRAARIARMPSARFRRSPAGGQIADRRGFAVGSQPVRRYCGGRRAPRPGVVRSGALRAAWLAERSIAGGCNDRYDKPAGERPFLDRYFGLTENGTDVRTEFIAGLTTFLTMVYIVFVNPRILSNAGMDKGAVFVATCIAAAVSTLVMALYANYPIALAPGMGLNAFFAFTVVLGYKYTWQQALAGCSARARSSF